MKVRCAVQLNPLLVARKLAADVKPLHAEMLRRAAEGQPLVALPSSCAVVRKTNHSAIADLRRWRCIDGKGDEIYPTKIGLALLHVTQQLSRGA